MAPVDETQQQDQPQDTAQTPSFPAPAGIGGQEQADIQQHLDAQPEQVPGTPGISLADRVLRIEQHLGLDRVFVHDAVQPE